MKSKKLISMVLSLLMIVSCLSSTFIVAQAAGTGFTNLVADPGFDGTLDTNVWVMSISAEGTITYETDTKDSTNKVLRVDCSGNAKNISWVNYKYGGTGLAEGKYYVHCKIRIASTDATEYSTQYAYAAAMSSADAKYFGATRPAITKDGWAECYGVFDATANKSVGFKMLYDPSTDKNNIAKAVYEIDDFTIYNLADAKTITVPEGINFTGDSVVKSHDNKYYAMPGSTVTMTYENDGYTLTADTADITQNETAYTFTVGNSNIAITEVEEAPSTEFENLVADPGFDGAYDSAVWAMSTSTNAAGVVSIETDTKNAENKVLRVDCSSNGEETTKISYVNYKSLDKGKYYLHCKVRLADVGQPEHENYYVYAASLGTVDVLYWDATRPAITKDGWAECYGVFDVTSNGASVGFKVIYTQGTSGNNVGKAVYEIDDFTIYSLANASNIAVPANVNFTSDNVVKSHDNTYYAVNGSEVAFNYGGAGLEALYINGEAATATAGVYSHAVSEDAIVLAVANQAEEGTVKYAYTAGKPYAIFDEATTVTLIVAGYDKDGQLTNAYFNEVTCTNGQILDLTEVEKFKDIYWADKTIFVWDNMTNLTPLRSACVLEGL